MMTPFELTLWNIGLTLFAGVIGYFMNDKFKALDEVTRQLNRTREEFARDHITRREVREDMQRIMAYLDKLDAKIDRIVETDRK